MASITPDTQIAAGNNNAAGLALINTLTDGNGIKFVMPRALPGQRRGARRKQLNGATTFIGKNSVVMISSVMTVLQYQAVLDTYEGLITIRLALDGITYANYNASLVMPDEVDLTYIPNITRISNQGDCGPGYSGVEWTVTDLVAL
jgi:hypothetical protein